MAKSRKTKIEEDIRALKNIKGRFDGEVGSISDLVDEKWMNGDEGYFGKGGYPYWSFLRMIMPVIESIGGLLYDEDSTTDNLKRGLEELAIYNENYRLFKETIILLYRHPLTHTDEMRGIRINKTFIGWGLSASNSMEHLTIKKYKDRKSSYALMLSPRQLIDDVNNILEKLIKEAQSGKWKGIVASRYRSWQFVNLNNKQQRKKFSISAKSIKALKGNEIKLFKNNVRGELG